MRHILWPVELLSTNNPLTVPLLGRNALRCSAFGNFTLSHLLQLLFVTTKDIIPSARYEPACILTSGRQKVRQSAKTPTVKFSYRDTLLEIVRWKCAAHRGRQMQNNSNAK